MKIMRGTYKVKMFKKQLTIATASFICLQIVVHGGEEAVETSKNSAANRSTIGVLAESGALLRAIEREWPRSITRTIDGGIYGLVMRSKYVNDETLKALAAECPNLEELTIYVRSGNNALTTNGVLALQNMKSLRRLTIQCGGILDPGLFSAVCQLVHVAISNVECGVSAGG
jgi:hypothetical protein